MVILSSSSNPLNPPAPTPLGQQILGSEACMLTSQFTAGRSWGSVVGGESGRGVAEDDQQMAHTLKEEEGATLRVMDHSPQSHTHASAPL